MASLTPLSKGLIALAVVGGMASAVWNLVLKDRLGAPAVSTAPAPSATIDAPAAQTAPAVAAQPEAPPVTGAQSRQLSAAENAERGRKLLASGDFVQARVHLEQAVKDGDGSAACHLGDMTLKGQGGITADTDKAARLFQLAQSRNIICFASGK
jgi:TPR repeat protein